MPDRAQLGDGERRDQSGRDQYSNLNVEIADLSVDVGNRADAVHLSNWLIWSRTELLKVPTSDVIK